ncbi:uncharacterized protein [Oryza sativa Japonica Group]|uniref:Os10g0461100 protein n=3 Tax=Oryza sativa subsp. japonica TaxID=39947 RepID=Q109L0_ORYSJ|nr:uncharacterized protein LOC4348816 isoform X2 [Oryza sativa Japonica Group]ABG66116.1 PsbP family protein, expressed [Oryza sativa Japonica Group]BAF26690.1 Os10g0461100 [Oryza sativa Japonica Group]BAT11171.1 Os10g0461100 [Oryza sativa Japonica Group]|eukprot:NP_001064776.1 Os10g0461100 [Oryza sativa Japonica Group]
MATPSTSASGPAPAPAPASSAFPLTAAARFLRVSAFSSTRAFALAERRRTPRCRLSEVGGGDRSVAAGRSPGPRSFHGLVLSGNAEGAMQSLRRELSSGMHPLRENFVALVHVFAKNDLTTKGMEILAAMERQSIKSEADTFRPAKIQEAFGMRRCSKSLLQLGTLPCCTMAWLSFAQTAQASEGTNINMVYEVGELFELGIQLSYLLILLGLLGAGTFFVIRQVLVRRELDLSAKELQEQVRSGDASATEYFELGAVMLRRKFYPAAIKYLQQAIQKWDRDEQDLAQMQSLRRELSSGVHPLHGNFVALVHVFAKNDLATRCMEILATMERQSIKRELESSRRRMLLAAGAAVFLSWPNLAANAAEAKKGFLPVTDKKDGYSFLYPFGWQEVVVQGQDKVYKDVIEPLESVSVNTIPTSKQDIRELGPPDQVAEALIRKVLAAPTQKTKLIEAKENDVDGRTYYTFEFTAQAPNFTRHALGAIAIANGKFYTLTTGANERRWEKIKDRLHTVVDSFKIEVLQLVWFNGKCRKHGFY